MNYTVTATIQSGDLSNPPIDVQWYTGKSLAQAVSAMAGAAVHDEEIVDGDLVPQSVRYTTLSVTLKKEA